MFLLHPWPLTSRVSAIQLVPLMLVASWCPFLCLTPFAFGQKADNWTDSTGEKTVVAEFVKLDGIQLTLRKADGKEIILPLSKLDDKSRLRARALAKSGIGDSSSSSTTSTSSTSGASAGSSKTTSTKSSDPVLFPSNATAQEFIDIVLRELKNENPIVVWDVLPTAKQKKIEEVFKLATTRVEQKTLNLIKKFRAELLTTLRTKKQFVLNSKALPIPPDQKTVLTNSYDAIVGMLEAIIAVEWLDASYLQNAQMRDLLSAYMDAVDKKKNELQNSLPNDSPIKAMLMSKPQSANVENVSPTVAMVALVVPGQPSAPAKFVLSEGRWLPEDVVTNWDQVMSQATGVLQAANAKEIHTKVGQALLIANGLLGSISTAETQEEFDERIGELMGMAGGMPRR